MGGKINKTKNWFFERVEKIDKLLAMLPKKESKNPSKQNKKWKRRCNNRYHNNKKKTHKGILWRIYANKFDNLKEMNKFLETYCPSKSNQEEIDNLNRLITGSEIES